MYFVDFVYSSLLDRNAVSRSKLKKTRFSAVNKQNTKKRMLVSPELLNIRFII